MLILLISLILAVFRFGHVIVVIRVTQASQAIPRHNHHCPLLVHPFPLVPTPCLFRGSFIAEVLLEIRKHFRVAARVVVGTHLLAHSLRLFVAAGLRGLA